MNEQIKELAEQAEEYADSIVDQGGEFHQAYTQKLAELIVRECMSVSSEAMVNGNWPPHMIAKHFGVEE